MTANLEKFNEDIKKYSKKYNFRKKSILIALTALLVSCGGGGGGGGGGSTSSSTPTSDTGSLPTAPVKTKPTVTKSASSIAWNDSTF